MFQSWWIDYHLILVDSFNIVLLHLSLKYHWFRSQIGASKGIVAKYVPSHLQTADGFTKGLPPAQFQALRKLYMGW